MLFHKAIVSTNSIKKLYSNLHINRGGASLLKTLRKNVNSESFDVEVVRFDDFCKYLSISSIRLIKIDIEGFELEALKGCGNFLKGKNAPILIVECSEERRNFKSCTEDLLNYIRNINDYRVFKLKGGKEKFSKLIELENKLPKHDNIICFLQDHISEIDQGLFLKWKY